MPSALRVRGKIAEVMLPHCGRRLHVGGVSIRNPEAAGETIYYPSPRSCADAGDPTTAECGDEVGDEEDLDNIPATLQQAK